MSENKVGKADDLLALDQQACFPLYAATNLINRLYRPVLARLELTYPQYLVMLVLWEGERQTVGSLGARLHLDSGTLTPLLKRMEGNGLIVRMRDIADERRVVVTLTAAGAALREAARDVPRVLAERCQIGDVTILREQVQTLIEALTKALDTNEVGDRVRDPLKITS